MVISYCEHGPGWPGARSVRVVVRKRFEVPRVRSYQAKEMTILSIKNDIKLLSNTLPKYLQQKKKNVEKHMIEVCQVVS